MFGQIYRRRDENASGKWREWENESTDMPGGYGIKLIPSEPRSHPGPGGCVWIISNYQPFASCGYGTTRLHGQQHGLYDMSSHKSTPCRFSVFPSPGQRPCAPS